MEQALADAPDGQISLTDPDARAMATRAQHSGHVGYNVQSVVDAETHLIVALVWPSTQQTIIDIKHVLTLSEGIDL